MLKLIRICEIYHTVSWQSRIQGRQELPISDKVRYGNGGNGFSTKKLVFHMLNA